MDTGCYFCFFYIVKLVTYILFYLVDFCTTIIGEINMINNNVDEHPIPPIWRHEKLISLKTGCLSGSLLAFIRIRSGRVEL